MKEVYLIAALGCLVTIIVGLYGLLRKANCSSMLLGLLLCSTTGAALLLALGKALELSRIVDLALVFALLAAVLGFAIARASFSNPGEGKL